MTITRRLRVALACFTVVVVVVVVAVVGAPPSGTAPGSAATTTVRSVPRVLGVRPAVVRGMGAVRVTVLGRGFAPGMSLTFGGHPAGQVAVRNPDAASVVAPPGVGTEVVRASTPAGTSAANGRSVVHYENRVLVVGDSLGIDLGWGFAPPLTTGHALSVTDDAVGSSGLVRTDFYDWPAHLRADLRLTHADVVVTMFGTNDDQAIGTSHGLAEPGTPAWDRAYAARVRQLCAIARSAGATVLWVGLPRMGPQSDVGDQFVAHLDALDRTVVAALPRAAFVDAWRLFTAPDGAYTPYVEVGHHDWALGHEPDGTHLTPAGATVIDVAAVAALMRLVTRR